MQSLAYIAQLPTVQGVVIALALFGLIGALILAMRVIAPTNN